MDYCLITPDTAYDFVLWFTGLKRGQFVEEYIINCKKDFDLFWDKFEEKISAVDISNIRFVAFHVLGSLDNCEEIRKNGLHNLQYVLREKTIMKKMLAKVGIIFDIEKKEMICDKYTYNIDYKHYQSMRYKSEQEEKLESIAHRIYYDYCVNGFLLNDDVKSYGTDIHIRPEFLHTLSDFCSNGNKIDSFWRGNSKSYIITFYAMIDQIHRFNFELEEKDEELSEFEILKIKRWMLSMAVDRAFDELSYDVLYVKDDVFIPPEQILSIEELI